MTDTSSGWGLCDRFQRMKSVLAASDRGPCQVFSPEKRPEEQRTTRIVFAPADVVQVEEAEDVRVGRRLVEVDPHELHRVRVDARRWLANVRKDVAQSVRLSPAHPPLWACTGKRGNVPDPANGHFAQLG